MNTVTELLQPVENDLDDLILELKNLIGAGHPILQAAAEHLFSAGGKRCLLYTSPSPRDISGSRMPSSA